MVLPMRESTKIISSSVFAAMAAILALLPLSFPFPIITFLKFDFAEIPIVLALLIYGFPPALLATIVYWIILLAFGSFSPIGPSMRFLATLSMVLGLYAGYVMFREEKVELNPSALPLVAGSIVGIIFRVLVMTLANYVVLIVLFPEFMGMAINDVCKALGWSFNSPEEEVFWVFAFIGIFNVLQSLLSIVPAALLVKAIVRSVKASRSSV